MGGTKHLMDEVAKEMGIQDPNDPRVKAEAQRRISLTKSSVGIQESKKIWTDPDDRINNKAEEISQQRYGREFDHLPAQLQMQTWMEAEQYFQGNLADGTEMRLSNR